MNNLCVFYGDDITRDGPQGLDLSRCQSQYVTVDGMKEISFRDVRRHICTLFGPEMARKKMIVEALICKRFSESYRWALRPVKVENSWGSYMKIASTPGAAVYEQPMVYVQFVDAVDEPGSSTAAGALQLSISNMAINTEAVVGEDVHVEDEDVRIGPYSMAIVDLNERMEGLLDELDSGDDDRADASDDDDEVEGGGPPRTRALAPPMAPEDIQALVIGGDDDYVRGVGATVLQENQQFPSKRSGDMPSPYLASIK